MSLPRFCLLAVPILSAVGSWSMAAPPQQEQPPVTEVEADADDQGESMKVVRELKLDDKSKLPRSRAGLGKPTLIENAEDLAKLITNEELRTQISQEVDFDTEHLLVFAWGGSGQDKLSTDVTQADDAARVVFLYTPGRTRDLRPHVHLFVVKQYANWMVSKAR